MAQRRRDDLLCISVHRPPSIVFRCEIAIVGPTADLIRYSIRIRILTPDSIRDSIRTQTADLQVHTLTLIQNPNPTTLTLTIT